MSGGFLDRWSRRKRDAETGAEATPTDPAPVTEAPEQPEPEALPDPAETADEALIASLPPIEEITAGTDIRAFLQKGVPAALRNAALRRAWAADPYIGSYEDPARDYFWDWNAPGGVPGGGGLLDPERVAKMARDIAGKVESQVQDSDPAAEAPAEAAAETRPEEPPADPTPAGHETVTSSAPEVAEPPAPAAPRVEPGKTACDSLPRRRHGGAMPG